MTGPLLLTALSPAHSPLSPPHSPLLLAALRIEAVIIGGSPPPLVIGMRAARLRDDDTLRKVSAHPGPVVILGYGGGLIPGLRPGDVVVASELRDDHGSVIETTPRPLRDAVLAHLREAGLVAGVGPLVTVRSLITGRDRGRLAAMGAVVVDMEAAPVALARPTGGVVVVRVVADTVGVGITGAALAHGRRLARALRTAAAATTEALGVTTARAVPVASR